MDIPMMNQMICNLKNPILKIKKVVKKYLILSFQSLPDLDIARRILKANYIILTILTVLNQGINVLPPAIDAQ
jgi:hypothetical protein